MLKRKPILFGIAAVVIIPVVAVGWWLLSPLLVDQTVDEELPFSIGATVPVGMEREEVEAIMVEAAEVNEKVDEPMPDLMAMADESMQDEEAMADESMQDEEAMDAEENMASDVVVDEEPAESMADEEMEQAIPTPESAMVVDETPEAEAMEEMTEAEAMESVDTPTPMPAPTAVPTATPEPTAVPTPVPTMVAEPTAVRLKIGNFQDADAFHKGSGEAVIYRGPDGSHLLRLENFDVTNGPDLHVILTPRQNPTSRNDVKAAGYVDLGKIKGNVGNQNYEIPDDVDVSNIESVVIYCLPFHVIFSVASLQEAG